MQSGTTIACTDCDKDLGAGKTASHGEIKKPYRALASTYHPDKTNEDKFPVKQFKNISQANDVPSGPAE